MTSREDLATVLLAYPGPLPEQARRTLLKISDEVNAFNICLGLIRRPDITLDDASRVRGNRALRTHASAWLARPEHPLADLPDLVATTAKGYAPDGLVGVVTTLMLEPLLRPEAAERLATCDNPEVTSTVAVVPTAPAELRHRAVLRTDVLLTPDPRTPPMRYNTTAVAHLRQAFTAAFNDRTVVADWCRQMRTPVLVLAAAASLERVDAATALHAVTAGVQAALRRPVNKALAAHISAVISLSKPHLDAATRIRLATALREHNSNNDDGGTDGLDRVAADLLNALPTTQAAVQMPLKQLAAADGPSAPHSRAAAAEHILTRLGDDPDAWRVLLANVTRAPGSATVDDLLTVVDGVTRVL